MINEKLLVQIEQDPLSEIERRIRPITASSDLPADWRSLEERYLKFRLFNLRNAKGFSFNGWELQLGLPLISVHDCVGNPESEELKVFYSQCYLLAIKSSNGSDVIGVSFNAGESFGKVFFATNDCDLVYGMANVALDIGTWLQRTFDAGFDSESYFFADDFEDFGPVFPNDPHYTGIKDYFARW